MQILYNMFYLPVKVPSLTSTLLLDISWPYCVIYDAIDGILKSFHLGGICALSLKKVQNKKVCFRSIFPANLIRDHIQINNEIVSAIESTRLQFHAAMRLGVHAPRLYPLFFWWQDLEFILFSWQYWKKCKHKKFHTFLFRQLCKITK